MFDVKQGRYRHYKGKDYLLVGSARHSETLEEMVVYKPLYNSKEFGENSLWIRPKKMFFETVFVNGEEVPRFNYIGE